LTFLGGDGRLVETGLDVVPEEDLAAAGPLPEFHWFRASQFSSGWYWSATTGGLVACKTLLERDRTYWRQRTSSAPP
jgi:hypothetical protein